MRRLVWMLIWERDEDEELDPLKRPGLMRWAIVGLAVVGVAAIIMFRLWTR